MTRREIFSSPYILVAMILGLIYVIYFRPSTAKYEELETRIVNFTDHLEKMFVDAVFSAIIWALLVIAFFL